MGMRVLLLVLIPLLISAKPCAKRVYNLKDSKSRNEVLKNENWAFEVSIEEIVKKPKPYIKVHITKLIKGDYASFKAVLAPDHCAKPIPSQKGEYLFFGQELGKYSDYIELKEINP
jgi:hypothetical protein